MWKRYNHKTLAGYLHSTMRFWDLRYFKCKKEFSSKQNPDLFLLMENIQKKLVSKIIILLKKV